MQISFFRDELGLSTDILRGLLIRTPSLLGLSTDSVREKVSWFQESLGVDGDDVRTRNGFMTPHDVIPNDSWVVRVDDCAANVTLRRSYALQHLLLNQQLTAHLTPPVPSRLVVKAVQVVRRNPQVLGYSIPSMQGKITFFQQVRPPLRVHACV